MADWCAVGPRCPALAQCLKVEAPEAGLVGRGRVRAIPRLGEAERLHCADAGVQDPVKCESQFSPTDARDFCDTHGFTRATISVPTRDGTSEVTADCVSALLGEGELVDLAPGIAEVTLRFSGTRVGGLGDGMADGGVDAGESSASEVAICKEAAPALSVVRAGTCNGVEVLLGALSECSVDTGASPVE